MTFLSIIILSYNTKDLTFQCLQSVIKQYGKEIKNKEIEIIVVDNASTDGSPSVISHLRQDFGGQANLKLIQNKKNLGFSKGCNIGAKAAKGEHILFLNSDTEILDRGFLLMADFLEKNKNVGVLGGRLLNPDSTLQLSGGN